MKKGKRNRIKLFLAVLSVISCIIILCKNENIAFANEQESVQKTEQTTTQTSEQPTVRPIEQVTTQVSAQSTTQMTKQSTAQVSVQSIEQTTTQDTSISSEQITESLENKAEKTGDVTFTVLTDKDTYNNGDNIQIILNVINESNVDVYSVQFDLVMPKYIKVSNDTSKNLYIEKLKTGESKEIKINGAVKVEEATTVAPIEATTVAPTEAATVAPIEATTVALAEATTVASTEAAIISPSETVIESVVSDQDNVGTGDKNNIVKLIAIIIISLLLIFILSSKKRRKFLSLFLCLIIVFETVNWGNLKVVNAEEVNNQVQKSNYLVFRSGDKGSKIVNKDITIGGKDTNISVEMSYGTDDAVSLNIDNFNYDTDSDMYYVTDEISCIKGLLVNPTNVVEMSYSISDQANNVLKAEKINALDAWTSNDFGLIIGKNILTIKATYKNTSEIIGKIVLYNLNEENMKNVDVDKNDNDEDGVLNYLEDAFGTDKNKADTDGDGLSDYEEIQILGTDPLKVDTNGNGINDGQEDFDNDGIDNITELKNGTNPLSEDTDKDGLSDSKEIEIKTNPLLVDTDGDGASDYWEYTNGFNPNVYNDNFDFTVKNKGEKVTAGVSVNIIGSSVESLKVEENTSNTLLNKTIPGYIDSAYDFSVNGTFDSAELTFEFPTEYLNDEAFDPAIYYYNTETQMLEELETSVIDNCAKTSVKHFSTYILLNRKEFDAVWTDDIEVTDPEKDNINMVFVIDYSASMDTNDPKYLRKDLTKNFISKLRVDKDQAAVVKFAAYATSLTKMTSNKELLYNAINSITNNSGSSCDSEAGTNGSDGINKALDLLSDTEAGTKYIVFMTDGEDTKVSYEYDALIEKAINSNVKIFTIGLGEAKEELLKKIAEKSGGKYYYATASELDDDSENSLNNVFEDIEDETIDKTSDSNGDGITDYLTRKICEKKLRLGTGASVFNTATYEKIQENDDFDHDGLKNGKELEVVQSGDKIYLKLNSYPDRKNSDNDFYSDYDEVNKIQTNPLKTEILYDKNDISYLTTDSEYVATKYKEFYDNKYYGWAEKGSVWIGNNLFGSKHSTTYLYKAALLDYFETLDKEDSKVSEYIEKYNQLSEVLSDIFTNISYAGDLAKEINVDQIEKLNELRNKFDDAGERLSDLAKKGIDSDITQDPEFKKLWKSAENEFIDLSGKIAGLDGKVTITKTIKKAGNVAEKVTTTLDIVGIVIDVVDFVDKYGTFNANMDLISKNIYLLDTIMVNTENEDLKDACTEVKLQISSTLDNVLISARDFNLMLVSDAATLIPDEVFIAIPVVGKYIYAAKKALDLADFMFNISDVSEACSYLYAMSSCSNLIGSDFSAYMSQNASNYNNSKYIVSGEETVLSSRHQLFNLTVMRKESELKMKDADEANSFLLEWLFTKYMYKISEINENIDKLDKIESKYIFY